MKASIEQAAAEIEEEFKASDPDLKLTVSEKTDCSESAISAKDKHDCFITNSDSEVLFKAFTIFHNLDGFNDLYQKIESVMDDVTKVKVGLEALSYTHLLSV